MRARKEPGLQDDGYRSVTSVLDHTVGFCIAHTLRAPTTLATVWDQSPRRNCANASEAGSSAAASCAEQTKGVSKENNVAPCFKIVRMARAEKGDSTAPARAATV